VAFCVLFCGRAWKPAPTDLFFWDAEGVVPYGLFNLHYRRWGCCGWFFIAGVHKPMEDFHKKKSDYQHCHRYYDGKKTEFLLYNNAPNYSAEKENNGNEKQKECQHPHKLV